jgi:hypothetical protein
MVHFEQGFFALSAITLSAFHVGREAYLRVAGRVVVVTVFGLTHESIWVSFPVADAIAEGTGVELELRDGDCTARYHARVVAGPSRSRNGIMLERAESATDAVRRRDWRVPVDLPVWLRYGPDTLKFKGRLMNITAEGAMVMTKAPFDAGETLDMIFQLPEFPPHQVTAKVVYSDKTQDDGAYRFGLQFEQLAAQARLSLTWFLYDQIHQLYPAELREMYPKPPARSIRVARNKVAPASANGSAHAKETGGASPAPTDESAAVSA